MFFVYKMNLYRDSGKCTRIFNSDRHGILNFRKIMLCCCLISRSFIAILLLLFACLHAFCMVATHKQIYC